MKPMYSSVVRIAVIAAMGAFGFACSNKPDPAPKTSQEEVETLHEKAERVGEFADRTITNGMKKNLTDIVDKQAEHIEQLEKSADQDN